MRVLSISSQVVHGHVGNSCAAFVLERLGHEVLQLPTVLLANRPGYEAMAGARQDPQLLDAILSAGAKNGWLASIDAMFTGYLPSAEHVALAAKWVAALKETRPQTIFLCDPILGDEPAGVYIDKTAALAVRDGLIGFADYATPNRFELEWLAGQSASTVELAASAAASLGIGKVVVTSVSGADGSNIHNVLAGGEGVAVAAVKRRRIAAHGTGDLFAALFLAHLLNGASPETALRLATHGVDEVLDATGDAPELDLIATQARWAVFPQ